MKKQILLSLAIFISIQSFAQKQTYVFVHGAWGGGWEYKQMDSLLTAQGHKVYRPTMTGLGERVHLSNTEINLSTHIKDIVNLILFENLQNIILVGHSYGGMVISGVANQLSNRINKLIFLDAFVPNDGESLFTARGETEETAMTKPFTKDGFVSYFFGPTSPNPPTDVPQPAKTFSETISLKNSAVKNIPTFFILMVPDGDADKANFKPFFDRAKQRNYKLLEMNGNHYPMRNQPMNLVVTLGKCR